MRSSEVWWKLPILSLQDNWACEMDLASMGRARVKNGDTHVVAGTLGRDP